MNYTVLIHPAEEGGYWTEVPALPGCFSQGETIEEALANTKEAIELHVSALRDEGQEISDDEGLLIGRVTTAAKESSCRGWRRQHRKGGAGGEE
jgi:predicted RNase H-like HicB family nuclease